jgi:hypothetical protein
MNFSQFSDSRLIAFPQINPLVAKLRARYGFSIDEPVSPAGVLGVRIALPFGSALLWDRATSLPRGPLRRHLLSSVSLVLQDTLRCWLPYLWLSHPSHWEDRDLLWPMLIYAASRTFKPTSRENYSFDLLCDTTVPSILRSCQPVLREWLPHLQTLTDGRRLVRREFRIQRLIDVVEHADFDPHPLKRLLSHEYKLISAFINVADGFSEERGVDRFGVELHRHLNRLYTRVDFSFIAPLLHIEAENILAQYLLGRPILEFTAQLTDPPAGAKPARLPRPGFLCHAARQPNRASSVQTS